MSDPREELELLLAHNWNLSHEALAVKILFAGWRPPLVVVNTVEELDALPDGAIVQHANPLFSEGYYKFVDEDDLDDPFVWSTPGADGWFASDKVKLPATVLFTPTEDTK